jgi:hypothetical protein
LPRLHPINPWYSIGCIQGLQPSILLRIFFCSQLLLHNIVVHTLFWVLYQVKSTSTYICSFYSRVKFIFSRRDNKKRIYIFFLFVAVFSTNRILVKHASQQLYCIHSILEVLFCVSFWRTLLNVYLKRLCTTLQHKKRLWIIYTFIKSHYTYCSWTSLFGE